MRGLDPRRYGLVFAGATLVTGAIVAGCATQIEGVATPNAADVTAHHSAVAASSAAATSSQIAATSSQVAAAREQAITDNCTVFAGITGVGVTKYNEFVDAHDSNAGDYDAKRDAAVTALDDAVKQVEGGMNAAGPNLPDDLRNRFIGYIDAARALAAATREMTYTSPVGPLNDASNLVNDARNTVRDACPA